MLASVYSYLAMVKSVSSCCVRVSRVLSNPVTFMQVAAANDQYTLTEQSVNNRANLIPFINTLYTITVFIKFCDM